MLSPAAIHVILAHTTEAPLSPLEARLATPAGDAILALLYTATLEHVLASAEDDQTYLDAGCPELAIGGIYYLASGATGVRVDTLVRAASLLARGLDPRDIVVGTLDADATPLSRATHRARTEAHADLLDALVTAAALELDPPPHAGSLALAL